MTHAERLTNLVNAWAEHDEDYVEIITALASELASVVAIAGGGERRREEGLIAGITQRLRAECISRGEETLQ